MEIKDDYDIKKIFEDIELELIKSMKRTLWYHKEDEKIKGFNWPQWQALKLKQMKQFRKENKEIFKGYESNVDFYINRQIKKQFREGVSRTRKQATRLGKIKNKDNELGGSFFGINDRKVNSLIKTVKNDLDDVKYATLRMSNDVYRSTIYKAEMAVSMGASTVQQAIDMATKDFLAKGFDCIIYKNGTKHNIADYCDMAVRTATKRANLMGEGEMRKKLGNPLVYISKHNGACDKCKKWQDRVYVDNVWSGGTEKSGKYPLLSTAIEGGLYHPRCRHGSSTYYPDINNIPETVEENEHDEKDIYNQNLQRRKKQYERLMFGSLYQSNILEYKNKALDLQNKIDNGKIQLTDDEQYAINNYISSDSYKINELLRNNLDLTEYQRKLIINLDSALDKMNNYGGVVQRSLVLNQRELDKFMDMHLKGNVVNYKAYISATNVGRYNNLSNIELVIKSAKGKDIRLYNKSEQEILFKRNTKFRVITTKKINDTNYIYLEELTDGK